MPNYSPRISISPTLPMFLFLYSGFQHSHSSEIKMFRRTSGLFMPRPHPWTRCEGQGSILLTFRT